MNEDSTTEAEELTVAPTEASVDLVKVSTALLLSKLYY
jgi:hypothetical protein